MNIFQKAIVEKCNDCCCGDKQEVKFCTVTNCALHPFRFGTNPTRKPRKPMSDEQKEKMSKVIAKAREAKLKKGAE